MLTRKAKTDAAVSLLGNQTIETTQIINDWVCGNDGKVDNDGDDDDW